MESHISPELLANLSSSFEADPKNRLAQNAVTKSGIGPVALNREVVNTITHTYSHQIETAESTDQKGSGRCWLFAGLNALRVPAMKKMKLEKFELSQAYQMFWDKLEKGNYFLENIIETRDEPLTGRLVMWLLQDPIGDGGQWDMFINIVNKYGVVPKEVMPETFSSSQTGSMNDTLVTKLREYASILRTMNESGNDDVALREKKNEMMQEYYTMLCIHLGTPPKTFVWEWRNKDKEFTRHGEITPLEFYQEYVGIDLDDMVCLINAPTKDKPFNSLFTVQYLGNVVGGQIVRYLNVDIAVMKKAAQQMIADGKPVWFGCDVGKMLDRDLGILDKNLYNYSLVYGTEFNLDKAARLDYGHSRMTHAMVLTGVDINEQGEPVRWRVENSWGDKGGDKGYMMMSDSWFDEYVYEITVHCDYLSDDVRAVRETDPIVLPPWDPMGALAR